MRGPVVLAWAAFQPRTVGLARDLDGVPRFVHHPRLAAHRWLAPVRYLFCILATWRYLSAQRPARVVVITPPVFAPLTAWAWCRIHHAELVVDCHTDAFDSSRWRWARPLHRWLLRRALAVLLHTEYATMRVAAWGAPASLVPDDLPTHGDAGSGIVHDRPTVVVAGSLDANEPVQEALRAARMLPECSVRLTGDQSRLPRTTVAGAPPNVTWTGYLAYPDFLAELVSANVVAAFSVDPGVMNRAAFEAVGLGRPLVLSDHPGLRARFGAAAIFTENRPEAMALAIRRALQAEAELSARSVALSYELSEARRRALDALQVSTPSA